MEGHPDGYCRLSGFTLPELLVVVVIMSILGALTIAWLGPNQNCGPADKAERRLMEIETALTSYEIDFGWFPIAPATGASSQEPATRNAEGLEGSRILYRELSGDFNEDGKPDKDATPYLKDVINNKTRSIETPSGGYWLLDPSNVPIRYLANNLDKEERMTFNPTFDLWSIADTDPNKSSDKSVRRKYITNYGFR